MSDDDPGWLVKDFNVLYRVTRELLMATGGGDETKVAHALNAVASQIERLKPAYLQTETIRLVGEFAGEVARGMHPDLTLEDIQRAEARIAKVIPRHPGMLFVSPRDEQDAAWRPCCGACGAEQIDGRTQVCLSCQSKWDGSEILPDGRRS